MSSLAHHGVKGQKWGVRRFQNKDGTLTREGYIRFAKKNLKHAKVRNLDKWGKSPESNVLYIIGTSGSGKSTTAKGLADENDQVIHLDTIFEKQNRGSIDRNKDFEEFLKANNVDISKASDFSIPKEERWKTYDAIGDLVEKYGQRCFSKGSKVVIEGVQMGDQTLYPDKNYFNGKPTVVLKGNIVRDTFRADRRDGISLVKTVGRLTDRERWEWYKQVNSTSNAIKYSSIGGNMNYIYGNTLVLGDSSYLEHHGIKNQKWGVRRFQNPDGSLTAAGRIRYGVTGAAKAAFKVGKKLGAATASAARAGVKKAQDNAYAKKKEKASQTREGVLKNKKMFTADELKALENRFKVEDEMSEARLRHGQAVAKTVSQYANTTRDVLSALQTGGNAVSAITKAFADIQSYKNAKGVAEAAKEKGMTTKEFDLFLKEKYPNAKKDDGSKKKDKNSNKAKQSDTDNNDDDNPPNNGGGGGGSKKQAEYAANRQKAQEAIYAKRKADLDSRESGAKQREDYLNKRQDALVKVSKQRQSEQDAREADLTRRDKAASEREAKLKETAKTAADVMSKLNKRQADLDKKESFLNSIESYRLDTLSEFKKNEEEAARRKKKNAKHSAIGEEMYADYLEHHGIKGQRWGVRRFQNADGSLTDKGRKHYQKKLALEERKLTAANASRGQYERVRTPMSVGMGILGAVAGAMVGVPAGPAGIAAGAAVVSSIAASSNYAAYTVAGIVAGQGAKRNMKKIAKYKEALAQDAFEIQNGVLIYGSGQSEELKHFGLKGMKWGVRRFQNKDGTRTAAGKKREKDYAAKNNSVREKFYYTDGTVRKGASAYVYKRGPGISSKYVGSERVGSTRKQAKAEAAAEALLFDKGRYGKTLSDRDRKRLQRDVRKGDEELSQIKTLASATEHKNLHDLERYKKAGDRLSAKAVEKRLVRDRQYFEKADASDLQTEKNIYHGHRYAAAIALGIGSGLASSGVLPAAAASVAVGASIVTALSSAATIDLHASAHRDVRLKNGMDKMDSTRQRDKLRERQEKEAERERKKQLRSKR